MSPHQWLVLLQLYWLMYQLLYQKAVAYRHIQVVDKAGLRHRRPDLQRNHLQRKSCFDLLPGTLSSVARYAQYHSPAYHPVRQQCPAAHLTDGLHQIQQTHCRAPDHCHPVNHQMQHRRCCQYRQYRQRRCLHRLIRLRQRLFVRHQTLYQCLHRLSCHRILRLNHPGRHCYLQTQYRQSCRRLSLAELVRPELIQPEQVQPEQVQLLKQLQVQIAHPVVADQDRRYSLQLAQIAKHIPNQQPQFQRKFHHRHQVFVESMPVVLCWV